MRSFVALKSGWRRRVALATIWLRRYRHEESDAKRVRRLLLSDPCLSAMALPIRFDVRRALFRQTHVLAETLKMPTPAAAEKVLATYRQLFDSPTRGYTALALAENQGFRFDDDALALATLTLLRDCAREDPVHVSTTPCEEDDTLARMNGLLQELCRVQNEVVLIIDAPTALHPDLLKHAWGMWNVTGQKRHYLGVFWRIVCLAKRFHIPPSRVEDFVALYGLDQLQTLETLLLEGILDSKMLLGLMWHPNAINGLAPVIVVQAVRHWNDGGRRGPLHAHIRAFTEQQMIH